MNSDNEKFDVDWDCRFDEDVIENVANYRKIFVNTTTDRETRKVFISEYDAIEYIVSNIELFNNKKVVVSGRVEKNEYNGKLTDRFVFSSLYIADESARETFRATTPYFFTKEDIDASEWKDSKRIYIDGCISTYIGSEKKNMYVKHQVIFDASKIDYNNDEHVKIKDFNLAQLKLEEVDGAIKNNLSSNKVYAISMELGYINGAEKVEFDINTLTENQRMSIELGIKTVDDFRPRGEVFGDRVKEYRIVGYNLRGDSADGVYEADDTVDEFNSNIYSVAIVSETQEENDAFKDLFE